MLVFLSSFECKTHSKLVIPTFYSSSDVKVPFRFDFKFLFEWPFLLVRVALATTSKFVHVEGHTAWPVKLEWTTSTIACGVTGDELSLSYRYAPHVRFGSTVSGRFMQLFFDGAVVPRFGYDYEVLTVYIQHRSAVYLAQPPRFAKFWKINKMLENSKTFVHVFGLFSRVRACNVSVATSGVFVYAGSSIC